MCKFLSIADIIKIEREKMFNKIVSLYAAEKKDLKMDKVFIMDEYCYQ